ncbi:DUF1439 domain-containing protein [Psychrosphaera sp. B3R10]|nr:MULTISPECIES: DUF1439 domain-containing protein [unclassified Psychrosphaera]MBU2883364.1 DUF1439 domain-containing protein [Psychrosphaera sp. I2R16]MBU2990542.1 DUF1439 domain-containing protein [Psychrosphaera sp. B3R10]MDO6718984.1 DUF1439 domain-containing protein [Psychrosphaera sp. 1_MG-2023]
MKVVFVFLLLVASCNLWALGLTKTIQQSEIQQKLDQMMPLERTKYFVKVKISDPKIALKSGQDALYIEATITASGPGGLGGSGLVGVTGDVEYRTKEGAFYLQNPKVAKLAFNDVPTAIQPKIKKSVEKLVAKALKKYPIYQLDDTDMKQKLAKSTIKSIKVIDEAVEVELSLF